MSVTLVQPDVSLRLAVQKSTALRYLKARIQQGIKIRRRTVRYMEDLEEARAAKAEWVHACTDMLQQMFQGDGGRAAADSCNDWVGRVYPDYAEMELFVGQFYEEMDHRLARLRAVAQEVIEMADHIPLPRPTVESSSAGTDRVDLLHGVPESATAPTTGAVVAAVEPEPEDPKPAPGGLLVVHESAASSAEPVRTFLHALGIAVRVIPATSQDANMANLALEQHRDAASFAVVLLAAADAGAAASPVAFQLGYLAGRLGLSRVCVTCAGDCATIPTNPFGVHCLLLDAANGWQLQLARHLKRAGVEVDLNKLC